jgi:2-succinyl-5-enolpyruvyl-6-hydroxy-3-cyclohexene-1-carboxylate synthase
VERDRKQNQRFSQRVFTCMKLPVQNLNSLWASLIVEELIRNGVDHFFLAPGYRCAPLAIAVCENPRAKSLIHYDERGLAFHALGFGRATGRPAAVINTSGTAVANGWPAMVEASMERVPLLFVTADRPPELRDTAANQTIDQVKIFGDHVRWFTDLPCPSLSIPPEMILTTVDQAVHRSRGVRGGPVHLNCMYRDPLEPGQRDESPGPYLNAIKSWLSRQKPYTQYALPEMTCPQDAMENLLGLLEEQTSRGLVVVGRLRNDVERSAVSGLIQALGWPACVDVTSGLRLGSRSKHVVTQGDILVRHQAFAEKHRPDTVLHLGGGVVSKHIAAFTRNSEPAEYILITDHPERQDPGHEVTFRVEASMPGLCGVLQNKLSPGSDSSWTESWQKAAAAMQGVLEEFSQQEEELSEPACAYLLSRRIPPEHGLFLANSMPVRDMDLFGDSKGPAVRVEVNRGASGVDGTIATAAGFAEGLERPVTILMGDLAFLHDLNSLNLVRKSRYPIILVVINNDGGGIFSLLPIARFEPCFEKYFVAPHGLTFDPAADMYGLAYYQPKTLQEFVRAYDEAMAAGMSAVVEVKIDRYRNRDLHLGLIKKMHGALET